MSVAIVGEFVTVADAARELSLSDVRVRQFFREGRIKGQIVGQTILLDRESFMDFKRQARPTGRPKKSA